MSTESTSSAVLSPKEDRSLGDLAQAVYGKAGWMVLVGGLVAILASFWHHERIWSTYLVGFMYVLSISLGALFFVIVQHLVRAGWSVTVRRVAEGLAWNVRFLPFLFLPLIYPIHQGHLMPAAGVHWAEHAAAAAYDAGDGDGGDHGEHGEHGDHGGAVAHGSPFLEGPHLPGAVHPPLGAAKETWLSFPWVMTRVAIYFVVWILIAGFYFRRSVAQDADADPAHTVAMQRWSPLAMILFGLTSSMVGFDLLMALDPYWFSTIFGVYFFAGSFLSAIAATILTLFLLQRSGRVTASVSVEHYQDLGKFMLAFVVFWAYIGYSQFMLIWYANIPEETGWYWLRFEGDWGWISAGLLVLHFVVPFLLLLSRFPKRRPSLLALGAVYVLAVHFLDLFWVVQPQKSPIGHMPAPLLDVSVWLAMAGLFVAMTAATLKGVSLIPTGDPRLVESLSHENY